MDSNDNIASWACMFTLHVGCKCWQVWLNKYTWNSLTHKVDLIKCLHYKFNSNVHITSFTQMFTLQAWLKCTHGL